MPYRDPQNLSIRKFRDLDDPYETLKETLAALSRISQSF